MVGRASRPRVWPLRLGRRGRGSDPRRRGPSFPEFYFELFAAVADIPDRGAVLGAALLAFCCHQYTVIAVPANRAQPASQVIFNIAFGDCFRTFVEGQPT